MGVSGARWIRGLLGAALWLALVGLAGAQQAAVSPPSGKELIAVMDLGAVGATKVQAIALTDRLGEELLKSRKFVLINRDQMDAVLNEQALQQSGCTSSECAVKVGQVLGVRKLVTGRVLKLDERQWQLTASIIDVETAQTLTSESIQVEGDFFALLQGGITTLAAKLSGLPVPAQATAPAVIAPAVSGASASVRALEGDYDCRGTNPNGSQYRGSVTVRVQPDNRVALRWQIANSTYSGIGKLEGRTLTVDWGDPYPVIYQVKTDGTLDGTWANGRATEVLTKR